VDAVADGVRGGVTHGPAGDGQGSFLGQVEGQPQPLAIGLLVAIS